LYAGFFSVSFDPEDGGNTFLRNIGLQTVMSQKMASHIIVALNTSNVTRKSIFDMRPQITVPEITVNT
jgi:hypothetical protein